MEYPRNTAPSRHRLTRGGFTALGILLTGIGIAGVFLPILPGTIFLILALACFARGNEQMEAWLLNHPRFGPTLQQWRANGGIRAKTKVMICTVITVSVTLSAIYCPNLVTRWTLVAVGVVGVIYVASRPTLADSRTS